MLDLHAEQVRLEGEMATLGIDKFRSQALKAREAGEATLSSSVSFVMDVAIAPTVKAIEKFIADAHTGKAGRRHSAVSRIDGLEASVIAFVTAKIVLDGLHREHSLTRVARRIGETIELEQRLAAFSAKFPKLHRAVTRDLDGKTNHVEHRKRVYQAMLRGNEDGWTSWTERDTVLVGIKLTELFVTATGLVEIVTERAGKKTTSVVRATRRFRDWLATLDDQSAFLTPEFMPCVIPPKPWGELFGGGYHTDAFVNPLPLVKTRSRGHREALLAADLSRVISAVNLIQATPWQVNRRVLEVVNAIHERGVELAGLPPSEDHELPIKPHDIDTNEEARKLWKRAAAPIHKLNVSLTSRRVQVAKTIASANDFEKYDAIYFPHQLDFRGRVYSVPQVLSPQGTDLGKGLLRLARGKPIDTPARLHWFFIHGANCFGVDKVDFDDRREWVERHHALILLTAADPYGADWWTGADSPICFLAWCFEYAEWYRTPEYAETPFVSHIPIAQDGSCNGLQHYSAMLRDPVGGEATNLTPSPKPQDIYARVADVVNKKLSAISELPYDPHPLEHSTDEWKQRTVDVKFARAWLTLGVDRKITKRPVMVLPYGGTQSSCQKYVLEAAGERIQGGTANPFGEDLFSASNWLGTIVWESIGEVVVAAKLAMAWLRDVASAVSKRGEALKWTTPSGFVVVQAYPKTKGRRIETSLFGKRFDPSLVEEIPDTIDPRRQANGIAPNFVHSMDAAALILTVLEAYGYGVEDFAMIHDSYGTHAYNTPVLASALREAFVRMYEESETLEQFERDVVPEHMRDKINAPPFVGGLDLNLVRLSPYFFA
ncbi:RNA polymerase [Rhizobium phage Pasto]|uniref:DNA-directed RNA polymerase n=1 Tax=Rhizobium phage Pasto TaxID=2767575 RepID=A0A7S6R735_9CAUD|nr:RNA polymerase [Rhizobium phage Pasto]